MLTPRDHRSPGAQGPGDANERISYDPSDIVDALRRELIREIKRNHELMQALRTDNPQSETIRLLREQRDNAISLFDRWFRLYQSMGRNELTASRHLEDVNRQQRIIIDEMRDRLLRLREALSCHITELQLWERLASALETFDKHEKKGFAPMGTVPTEQTSGDAQAHPGAQQAPSYDTTPLSTNTAARIDRLVKVHEDMLRRMRELEDANLKLELDNSRLTSQVASLKSALLERDQAIKHSHEISAAVQQELMRIDQLVESGTKATTKKTKE